MCIDLYNELSNMTHGEVAGDNCKIIKSISGELIMVNVKNPENTVIIDPWKLTVKTIKNIIFDFMGKEPLHDELIQEDANAKNLIKSYTVYDKARNI